MNQIPKIKQVKAIDQTRLAVTFENGVNKIYDCESLLQRPQFQLLRTYAFFKAVQVDVGGYGISWNDDLDLSEYELWTKGQEFSEVNIRNEK